MLIAGWLNGVPMASLGATERGFAYGDGHFTTIAVRQGNAVLLDYHWRRLHQASEQLGMSCQSFPLWQERFDQFISHYPNITAKIVITRGCGGRGYLPDERVEPNCYFLAWPAAAYPPGRQGGIATDVLPGRMGLNPMLAGLKHLNRLEQVMLRRELALTPFPEAIVCDLDDNVIEGVFSNLFLVKDELLYTPMLEYAGVAGVMRGFLMEFLDSLQRPVREIPLRLAHLEQADELFFCNSLYGIWPVTRFGGRMMPANPVTQRLQQHLKHARITS